MSEYAKGSKPQDLEGACGGLVLDRLKNFEKNPDPDYHPLGTGLLGPFNTEDYSKGARDPRAKRTGDKCLPAIKPRK